MTSKSFNAEGTTSAYRLKIFGISFCVIEEGAKLEGMMIIEKIKIYSDLIDCGFGVVARTKSELRKTRPARAT